MVEVVSAGVPRIAQIARQLHFRIQGIVHLGRPTTEDAAAYAKIPSRLVVVVDPTLLSADRSVVSGEGAGALATTGGGSQSGGPAAPPVGVVFLSRARGRRGTLQDILVANGFAPSNFSLLRIDASVGVPTFASIGASCLEAFDAVDLFGATTGSAAVAALCGELERAGLVKSWAGNEDETVRLFVAKTARRLNSRPSHGISYRVPRDLTKPESTFLHRFRRTVTSQLGEDGILEKVFETIGVSKGYAVELAAGDGVRFSNCWTLWEQSGWRALLVDREPANLGAIRSLAASRPQLASADATAYPQGFLDLDRIMADADCPRSYDLLSLDVWGNEWAVWDAHALFRPKVVCVGFNPSFSNTDYYVQAQSTEVRHGSSLLAHVMLGKRKGYELVAATRWNAIFVSAEFFPLFNISDNSPDAIYAEQAEFVNSFYMLYDGTVGVIGSGRHPWKNRDIDLSGALPAAETPAPRAPRVLSTREFEASAEHPTIYLTPTGGLVNRLMAVVSCMRLASLFQRRLLLNWAATRSLACPWDRLFATPMGFFEEREATHVPPEHRFNLDASVINGRFRVTPEIDLHNVTSDLTIISNCFIGHNQDGRGTSFWNFTPSAADVGKYFGRLIPSTEVVPFVDSIVAANHGFVDVVGLHVRRGVGDTAQAQANFNAVTDEDYARVIQEFTSSAQRVFIATDSEVSRANLSKMLGERVIFYAPRSYAKDQEAEAIQDALVEFLLLTRCSSLFGNNFSTFAYFASQIGLVPYNMVSRDARGLSVRTHRYRDASGGFAIAMEDVLVRG